MLVWDAPAASRERVCALAMGHARSLSGWDLAGPCGDAGREAGARGRARAGAGAQSIPVGEAILRRLPVRTDCILPDEDAPY